MNVKTGRRATGNMKWLIYLVDFAVLAGTLVIMTGLVEYYSSPILLSPEGGFSEEVSVLFEFSKDAVVFIDNNLEFSSPKEIAVRDGLVIGLKPGIYYWKMVRGQMSEVRELNVKSNVRLMIREIDGKYQLVNSGDKVLNVDIYDKGKFVGNVELTSGGGEDE